MTSPNLTVVAKCRASNPCVFNGSDLFLDIRITNNGTTNVGFPLAFVQKGGPVIKLVDTRTKASTFLRRNLADFALLDVLTPIPPGQSIAMEWVIAPVELRTFGLAVDLSAEITLATKVRVDQQTVEFSGTDTLRIVDKTGR
jgi:hypothetical protein